MRLAKAMNEAELFEEPYKHFIISNWAEPKEYDAMIANLPPLDDYHRYNMKYVNRYLYSMNDPFWSSVSKGFHEVYGRNIRVQMCRDLPGYQIGPHTDGRREEATILFYLTPTEEPVGTSVYIPEREGFTCDGTKHHDFQGFKKVKQARYAPNMGFGFIRSDNSFHGVEPCDIERNLIQVSIWA